MFRRSGRHQFMVAGIGGWAGNCGPASDHDQLQIGSDAPQIHGIAGHDGLSGPLRTNDDAGGDDVGRRGSPQQQAGSRRVRSVERHQVRARLSYEPGDATAEGLASFRVERDAAGAALRRVGDYTSGWINSHFP